MVAKVLTSSDILMLIYNTLKPLDLLLRFQYCAMQHLYARSNRESAFSWPLPVFSGKFGFEDFKIYVRAKMV
jgi:hypothetical protein